jgi:hypothetical protein
VSRILGRKLRWRRKPAFLKTSLWIRHTVEKLTNKTVAQGPFKGMRYGPDDPGPSYLPQLLGTYELELHDTIEEHLDQHDKIINAGSGIGYFAVGLAFRTDKRITAYEANEAEHPKLQHLAKLNNARHLIEQKGACTTESLQHDLEEAQNPFLFMDVESAEDFILVPDKVPALAKTTILIETHDFLIPNITQTLIARFGKTHEIKSILTRSRTIHDLPESIPGPLKPLLKTAMREHRGIQQTWLLMTPK